MFLSVKTKRNSEPQPFPFPVSVGSLPHSAGGPPFPYSFFHHLFTHRNPSHCLLISLSRFCSIQALSLLKQHLCSNAVSILLPDHLSLLPPSVCFLFVFEFTQEILSMSCSWYFWLTFWCRSGVRKQIKYLSNSLLSSVTHGW